MDTNQNQVKVFESTLERDVLTVLMANRRVARIDDQAPRVGYVDTQGRRAHVFDFRAVVTDGRRLAYAVKPARRVEPSGLSRTIELICDQQALAGVADSARIITEREVTRRCASNARAILRARRARNEADVALVRKTVDWLNGSVRITALAESTGLGARGRTAVIALIDEGALVLEPGAWLDHDARVWPATAAR